MSRSSGCCAVAATPIRSNSRPHRCIFTSIRERIYHSRPRHSPASLVVREHLTREVFLMFRPPLIPPAESEQEGFQDEDDEGEAIDAEVADSGCAEDITQGPGNQ